MGFFEVEITIVAKVTETVEASSKEEAEDIVDEMIDQNKIDLSYESYEVEITNVEEVEE